MCTVKELIEVIERLPPHTVVNVLEVYPSGYDNIHQWIELDISQFSESCDFIDLKDNPFCTDEERKKTPTLDLGAC